MDKSMVQELTAMAQSNIFKPRQSFISTQYSDLEGSSLRKSRIHNYPGYKREDLSGKLNFVVVFQTIEIERLSWEIEKQRVNLLDLQRQHANCYNYEVQIRELTERIHQLECERERHEQRCAEKDELCERIYMEYEAYKAAYGEQGRYEQERRRSEELQAEADMWRTRCSSLAKEMEAAKRDMSSRESRTLKELTTRHELENNSLRAEAERLRTQVAGRGQQLEEMQHVIALLRSRDSEISNIKHQMEEYENKCAMISQENYRLNELLRLREADVARSRQAETQLSSRLQEMQSRDESSQWSAEVELKTREIADLKRQISKSSEELAKTKQTTLRLGQLQKLNSQYSSDIQSLSSQLQTRSAETEEYRNRVSLLESKISTMNNATQQKFASYEETIMGYMREEEKLKTQLSSKAEESKRLQQRAGDVEQVCLRIKTVEEENEALRQELAACSKTIEELTRKIRRSEESLALLQDLEKRLNQEQGSRREMIAARQRHEETIRSLSCQLETATQKNTALLAQLGRSACLQSELSGCHTTIASISQQLARIHSELVQRSAELAQLRETVRSLSSKAQCGSIEQMLNQNMQQMEAMVLKQDDLRRENDKLHNDNMILDFSLRKMEAENIALSGERQEMQLQLRARVEEAQAMQAQLAGLAGKVGELRETQMKVVETQKQLDTLKSAYEQVESRYRSECRKADQFSMQVEQLSSEMLELRSAPRLSEQMTSELTLLRSQAQEKDALIAELRIRTERIEKILRVLRQKYELALTFATTLHQSIDSCSGKLDFFASLAAALQTYSQPADNYEMPPVQMCESMRVLQEVDPVRNVMLAQQHQKPKTSHYNDLERIETETALARFDRIYEREDEREGESSLSSSLINTLLTKESYARFDTSRMQHDPHPGFGRNTSAQNLHYPLSQSPARYGNLTIDTQMETSNVRQHQSPNNLSSPIHEVGFSGLPRVFSHTIFPPASVAPSKRSKYPDHPAPSQPAIYQDSFASRPAYYYQG